MVLTSKSQIAANHKDAKHPKYTVLSPAQKLVFSNILVYYSGDIMACVDDLLEYFNDLQKKKQSLASLFMNSEQEKRRRTVIYKNLKKDLQEVADELGVIMATKRHDIL